jgi:tRNA-modifying protein YgfZ
MLMPDNPQSLPDRPFALPGHGIVMLDGPDAVAFAQAQFMNDVAALEPGRWHWNGWLTPKGRIIALFALLRVEAQCLWLVLPDADVDTFAADLKRFVFRSKLKIAVRDDLAAQGKFDSPRTARANAVEGIGDGALELDCGSADALRTLTIAPRGADAGDDDALVAEWSRFDLEHGLPRLPASQATQWTPQQLSLERLGAFSVRKGCYPGQEIVARTHFLGKAKRGLALLEAGSPLEVGAEVSDGEATLGPVISTASTATRHLALAVVGLDRAQPALRAGDIAVREVPLREGLQR